MLERTVDFVKIARSDDIDSTPRTSIPKEKQSTWLKASLLSSPPH